MTQFQGTLLQTLKVKLSEVCLSRPTIQKAHATAKLYYERMLDYPKLKKQFYHKMGYELNLDNPVSFNQKIVWKKINDRNPNLTITADKYLVRDYLKLELGLDVASEIEVPVLWVGEKGEEIPFDQLPEKFVVKPNHGSNMHILVRGNKNELRDEIVKTANKWMKTCHGLYCHEWAYRNIKPKIIVEQLLETATGELPEDYKLFCIHGKCRMIRVAKNRFGDENSRYVFYDTQWNPLNILQPGYIPSNIPFEKPRNLQKLIKLAEQLSSRFDAVRIDMYNVDEKVFFGEFTHYHSSGLSRFEPQEFDFALGAYWKLENEYWKNRSLATEDNLDYSSVKEAITKNHEKVAMG